MEHITSLFAKVGNIFFAIFLVLVKEEKKEARNEGAMKLDPLSNWDFSRRMTMLSTSLSSLFCPVIFQFLSSAGASENRGKTRRQTLSPLSPEKEDISHRKQRTVWLPHPKLISLTNVYAQLDKKTYQCGKVGVPPLLFREIFFRECVNFVHRQFSHAFCSDRSAAAASRFQCLSLPTPPSRRRIMR